MAYFLYNITDIDFTGGNNNCLSTVVHNGSNDFLEFLDSMFRGEYIVSPLSYANGLSSYGAPSSTAYIAGAGLFPVMYRDVWTLFFQLPSTHSDTAETLLSLYNTDLEPLCTRINVCPSAFTVIKDSAVLLMYDCTVEHAGDFKKMADTCRLVDGCENTLIFADSEKDILQYIKELKILIKCAYKYAIGQRYDDGYKNCRYFLSYEERMKCCSECRQKRCKDRLAGKHKNIFSIV